MQLSYTGSKKWYMSSAVVCIKLNIIDSLGGIAKQITKSILPDFKQKKGKLCLHVFKCLVCHSNHQADSNQYSFWKHRFNHEWHSKKQIKIHENRNKSICSVMSSIKAWFLRILKFFLKMFARTILLSIPSSKHVQILILFSSRSHLRHVYTLFWVYSIVKIKN